MRVIVAWGRGEMTAWSHTASCCSIPHLFSFPHPRTQYSIERAEPLPQKCSETFQSSYTVHFSQTDKRFILALTKCICMDQHYYRDLNRALQLQQASDTATSTGTKLERRSDFVTFDEGLGFKISTQRLQTKDAILNGKGQLRIKQLTSNQLWLRRRFFSLTFTKRHWRGFFYDRSIVIVYIKKRAGSSKTWRKSEKKIKAQYPSVISQSYP